MVSTGDKRAISDLEYDLVTVLHEKSKALQVYEEYIQDAKGANAQPCVELFQKIQQQDMEHARELRQHLQQVLQKG